MRQCDHITRGLKARGPPEVVLVDPRIGKGGAANNCITASAVRPDLQSLRKMSWGPSRGCPSVWAATNITQHRS